MTWEKFLILPVQSRHTSLGPLHHTEEGNTKYIHTYMVNVC